MAAQGNPHWRHPDRGGQAMNRAFFIPLPVTTLVAGATFHRLSDGLPERVTVESPALDVMTDLRKVPAVTVEAGATIDEANTRMIRNRVRSLLVADEQDHVLGLITATDILGEKPVQAMHARSVARNDVLVIDVMTPRELLEVINLDDVRASKVGHVLATLRRSGRQHAIVVEVYEPSQLERLHLVPQARCAHTVCGLFSLTQIARQLGLQLHTTEVAATFAEVEAQLAH
jgi:predicted transcriptional regulator